MSRRREDRVVSCLMCGDVLGIYVDGLSGPPPFLHVCAPHDALDRDLNEAEEIIDEIRAGRGEEC